MAQMRFFFNINCRAGLWLEFLARQSTVSTITYINQVLLKHLHEQPGVDLSQSPYSEPKGVSNGEEERGEGCIRVG